MAGFSDRAVKLEWDGEELSFDADDAHLASIYSAAESLTETMPDAGTGDYAKINETVHGLVAELFGDDVREKMFGGRPESVIDSVEVLAAVNRASNAYMASRVSAALAAYDPSGIEVPGE